MPEDLHRPRDLTGIQGIKRMADPGRTMPVGAVVTGSFRVLARCH